MSGISTKWLALACLHESKDVRSGSLKSNCMCCKHSANHYEVELPIEYLSDIFRDAPTVPGIFIYEETVLL